MQYIVKSTLPLEGFSVKRLKLITIIILVIIIKIIINNDNNIFRVLRAFHLEWKKIISLANKS